MRLAPKARCIQRQPGAAPQEKWSIKNRSAKGAIHLRTGLIQVERLKCAFSAGSYGFRSPANYSASPLVEGERIEVTGSKARMAGKIRPSP